MLPSQFELECQPACVYSELAFWDLFYLPGRLMFLLISSIRSSFLSIKLITISRFVCSFIDESDAALMVFIGTHQG